MIAVLVVVTGAIGYVDYITGPEVGLSLFYLIPIVVAASYAGRAASVLIASMAAFCWFLADYLIRVSLPISLWNGLTRLVIYTSLGVLVARLRREREREAVLARTDSVTGLPNSRAFRETLEAILHRGQLVSVMYIDLDNFKRVNDLFGHAVGDAILQQTGVAMQSSVGPNDLVARVGGDEFAILLHETERAAVQAIADRILASVQTIASRYPGTALGASIGVAVSAEPEGTAEELIQPADLAMYEAKQRRKGSYEVRVLRPPRA